MLDVLGVSVAEFWTGGLIIFSAIALQSAVGFGSALLAIPMLVWVGFPLPDSIVILGTCSTAQGVMGTFKLRDSVPWRTTGVAACVMTIGRIIGILMLTRLVRSDPEHIKAVIGAILCLLVAMQVIWKPKPVDRLHWGWGGTAFLSGGVLGGLCGMNGPPIVLWAMAHDWPTSRTRGFFFSVFGITSPIGVILLLFTFGTVLFQRVALGLAYLPLVYLGVVLGLPVGSRMNRGRLRNVAFGVLFAMGASAVVRGLVSLVVGDG